MAVQFNPSGTVLFKVSGTVAMDADCCCGCTPCCEGVADKALFITISDLTLDGGETCDDDCLPAIAALESLDTGGGETPCDTNSTTWLVDPAVGTAEFSVLRCVDGAFVYRSDGIFVRDGGGAVCSIDLVPSDQALTGLICDPFYWEGDLTVEVRDPGGGLCGTGTIHLIITE